MGKQNFIARYHFMYITLLKKLMPKTQRYHIFQEILSLLKGKFITKHGCKLATRTLFYCNTISYTRLQYYSTGIITWRTYPQHSPLHPAAKVTGRHYPLSLTHRPQACKRRPHVPPRWKTNTPCFEAASHVRKHERL